MEYNNIKFDVNNDFRECSNYSKEYELFLDKQSIYDAVESDKLFTTISSYFRTTYKNTLTLDQLRKIVEIMEYKEGLKTMDTNSIMNVAIDTANETMCKGYGGPFGAVIVDSEGCIVATGSNSVLKDHDPTAHGEINAIRSACAKLDTHDLSGYTLYTTAYPCPMCMSAIIWSNIKTVYYGCTPKDTEDIGFRDNFIYSFLENEVYKVDNDILTIKPVARENCLKLFGKYQKINPTLY